MEPVTFAVMLAVPEIASGADVADRNADINVTSWCRSFEAARTCKLDFLLTSPSAVRSVDGSRRVVCRRVKTLFGPSYRAWIEPLIGMAVAARAVAFRAAARNARSVRTRTLLTLPVHPASAVPSRTPETETCLLAAQRTACCRA